MMSIFRNMRLVAGAVMLLGMLVGMGGVTPQSAQAIPGGDPEDPPCIPITACMDPQDPQEPPDCEPADGQPVLAGFMLVEGPSMVGHPTRIRISAPRIEVCSGALVILRDPVSSWSVARRPQGSTAVPTQVSRSAANLVADRPGDWEVVYIACPHGCAAGGVSIPPLSASITFTAIPVVEGRIGSDLLQSSLHLLLADSRVQISHTGNGSPAAGTPYTVRWSMPAYKYQQLCEPANPPPNWTEPPICDPDRRVKTLHTVTPQLWSYIDFGPTAEAAGAPSIVSLPIAPVERDANTAVRVALGAATGGVFDVDRIRLLINNVHLNLRELAKWSATIEGGGINLRMRPDSSHPTVECEGHWRAAVGYILTVAQGWADEMCPDFDLSSMELSVKLVPGAKDGLLMVNDVHVAVQMEPQGVQSSLIDFMVHATTIAKERIASITRSKLMEDQIRLGVGKLLTKGFRHKFPDMCRVIDARVAGSELVVQYQKKPASPNDMPCTDPLAMP
jgi:hypothetical protein